MNKQVITKLLSVLSLAAFAVAATGCCSSCKSNQKTSVREEQLQESTNATEAGFKGTAVQDSTNQKDPAVYNPVDNTDIYAIPLDQDEVDQDLEMEKLEQDQQEKQAK